MQNTRNGNRVSGYLKHWKWALTLAPSQFPILFIIILISGYFEFLFNLRSHGAFFRCIASRCLDPLSVPSSTCNGARSDIGSCGFGEFRRLDFWFHGSGLSGLTGKVITRLQIYMQSNMTSHAAAISCCFAPEIYGRLTLARDLNNDRVDWWRWETKFRSRRCHVPRLHDFSTESGHAVSRGMVCANSRTLTWPQKNRAWTRTDRQSGHCGTL